MNNFFQIVRFLFFTYFSFFIITSCQLKNGKTLSENELASKPPVTRPFKLPAAKPIKWKEYPQDSTPKPETVRFNLDKLPSKPFGLHAFKPLKAPLGSLDFDWDKLEQVPMFLDTLKPIKFIYKKFLLPKPAVTQATAPGLWEKGTSGIVKLGQAEGLLGSKVFAIVTDPQGGVWISTERGLSKYNGSEFMNYNFFVKDETGGTESIPDLVIDKQGRLIATANASGIFRIDLKTGIVENYYLKDKLGIGRLTFDATGKIWGTNGNIGLINLEKKVAYLFKPQSDKVKLPSAFGHRFDSSGRLWLAFQGKVGIVSPDLKNMRMIGENEGLLVKTAYDFTADAEGNMWVVASNSDAAYSISLKKEKIFFLGKKQGFNGRVLDVFTDKKDRVWILSNDTVTVYDPSLALMKKMVTGTNVVLNNFPSSGMTGNDGTIWLGSNNDGVLLIDPEGMLSEHFSIKDGLESNDVWGIQEDSKGRIWIISYKGINIYDPATERLSLLKFPQEMMINEHRNIYKIGKDVFFLGTIGGFGIIDLNTSAFTFYNTRKLKISDLSFTGFQMDDGSIWFSGGDGVIVYDPAKKTIKALNEAGGLVSNLAFLTRRDKQGRIWVITEKGANLVDARANTIITLNESSGLQGNYTSMFFESSRGDIFIGGEFGLSVFDKDLKTITNINAENGMSPPAMYDMTEVNGRIHIGSENGIQVVERPDSKDKPWKFYNYNKSAGFPYNDYNQATVMVASNGQTWWAASPVMTVTHQDPVIDLAPPSVHIKGINIMDQNPVFHSNAYIKKQLAKGDTLTLGGKKYTKDKLPADQGYLADNKIEWDDITPGFQMPVGLKLPYHQNSFNFSFTNQSVTGRDKIVYRYFLEGQDEEWSEASAKNTSRIYYNMAPGNYAFKVISKGFNGVWSQPDVLKFTISPPWWRTWWAYTIFVLMASLIVYFIVKLRSGWLEKENRILEEKVRDRTSELNQKMEELKSTQAQLIQSEKMASLGELTAGIAHEIQNPLNFVNNFSEVSVELIEELAGERRKEDGERDTGLENELLADISENLRKISHHGKRADAIVKGMLQHSGNSNGQKEPADLNALCDEYLRLSYHGLRAKDKSFNATLKTDFDTGIGKINVVSQDMGRVILNLLTNAFYAVNEKKQAARVSGEKYDPTVAVSTKKSGDKIEIKISDNGNGIPQRVLDKIFQPFFTTKPTGQGTGLGLSLSYDIVTKGHNGELKVETQEGRGTTFIIILPAWMI